MKPADNSQTSKKVEIYCPDHDQWAHWHLVPSGLGKISKKRRDRMQFTGQMRLKISDIGSN